tara:strand:+ start:306 stop:1004 length:699 start_codon:yes stop_codon:yes gene_type:complete
MSNYIKAVNFAVKDDLVSGDPSKIIKGTEINTEYNNIATAVATKAETNSPAFTGNPTAPTQTTGNNTTRLATTAFVATAISSIPGVDLSASYPVGSIYMATVATNPATLLGFGTWVAFGQGRVLLGADGTYAAGSTGGSTDAIVASHTHTDSGHNHTQDPHAHTVASGNSTGDGSAKVSKPTSSQDTATLAATSSVTATNQSSTANISTEGVSPTNANLQPYIAVYIWNRTV